MVCPVRTLPDPSQLGTANPWFVDTLSITPTEQVAHAVVGRPYGLWAHTTPHMKKARYNGTAIAFLMSCSLQLHAQQLPRPITPLVGPETVQLQSGSSAQCITKVAQRTGVFGRSEDAVLPLNYSITAGSSGDKVLSIRFENPGKPQVRIKFRLKTSETGGVESQYMDAEQRLSNRDKWEQASLFRPASSQEPDEARDYPLQAFELIHFTHSFDYWKSVVERRFTRGASVQLEVCGRSQQTNMQIGGFKLDGNALVNGRESLVFSGQTEAKCLGGGQERTVNVAGWMAVDTETGLPTGATLRIESTADSTLKTDVQSDCTIFSP